MLTIVAPRCAASRSVVSMRGWFVPGFWPITKIRSQCSKSSSETVPLPTPIDLEQRDAARLVAHVRAVGEVVRAEHAADQLVQERGLVRRAARRVERRCASGPAARSSRGDHARTRRPSRSRGSGGPRPSTIGCVRRPSWPSSKSDERAQLVDGVPREQLGRRARGRRLLGQRLRAVLAELEPRALAGLRLRPRAAGAVEAAGLVHREQRLGAAREAGVAPQVPQRRPQRAEPAGGARHLGQLDVGERDVGCSSSADTLGCVTMACSAPWRTPTRLKKAGRFFSKLGSQVGERPPRSREGVAETRRSSVASWARPRRTRRNRVAPGRRSRQTAKQVTGLGRGSVKLELDQTKAAPGGTINGRVVLALTEPVEAKRLVVSLRARQKMVTVKRDSEARASAPRTPTCTSSTSSSAARRRTSRETIAFELTVPPDALELKAAPPTTPLGEVARTVASAVSPTAGPIEWQVVATLEIPWGRNLTNDVDIVVTR